HDALPISRLVGVLVHLLDRDVHQPVLGPLGLEDALHAFDESAPEAVPAAVVADVLGLAHGMSPPLSLYLFYVSVGRGHLCSRFVESFAMRTVFAALLVLAGCASPSARPVLERGLVASPEPH